MAVSNAIGSNIFDILVGLGFPFLVAMLIHGGTIQASGQNLMASTVILFASLLAFVVLLLINRWKVNWITGVVLIGLYVFYVVREIVLL
jgi:Ca2+/Na+ antiporter